MRTRIASQSLKERRATHVGLADQKVIWRREIAPFPAIAVGSSMQT
jgi:hypothetical protein